MYNYSFERRMWIAAPPCVALIPYDIFLFWLPFIYAMLDIAQFGNIDLIHTYSTVKFDSSLR